MAGRACEPQQKHTAPGHKEGIDWAYKKKIQLFKLFAPTNFIF